MPNLYLSIQIDHLDICLRHTRKHRILLYGYWKERIGEFISSIANIQTIFLIKNNGVYSICVFSVMYELGAMLLHGGCRFYLAKPDKNHVFVASTEEQ